MALALAEEYIAYDIDDRTTAAREAVDWIAEQIEQQRADVAAAEAALVAYRTVHPDVPLGDDDGRRAGPGRAAGGPERGHTTRIARRAAYRQVADAAGDPARLVRLPALTAERRSPFRSRSERRRRLPLPSQLAYRVRSGLRARGL